jgi:hypothetical protein
METKILLSPVHQLVIPPPPEAAWYAPWRNPNFSWWDVAAWINPITHIPALFVNFLSNQSQKLSNFFYDQGYLEYGLYFDVAAQLGHTAAGIIDLPGTIVNLLHTSTMVGERYTASTDNMTLGILAGEAYFVGSLTGLTPIAEGFAGENFATGEAVTGADQAALFFSGGAQLILTGIGIRAMLPAAAVETAAASSAKAALPSVLEDFGAEAEARLAAAKQQYPYAVGKQAMAVDRSQALNRLTGLEERALEHLDEHIPETIGKSPQDIPHWRTEVGGWLKEMERLAKPENVGRKTSADWMARIEHMRGRLKDLLGDE